MSEYKFYLGIGPMSMEIVDAVNEYVYPQNTQKMWICINPFLMIIEMVILKMQIEMWKN